MHSSPVARVLRWPALVLCVWLGACHDARQALDWVEVSALIEDQFPDVPSVTTSDLADALAAGRPVVLLDARTADEFAVSHLQYARRVTSVDDAVEALANAPADALVVAYCSVGYRSAALVDELQRHGITRAVNLEGSIFAWANEDRPVYREDTVVAQVHPFDDSWGTLLDRRLWAFEPLPVSP